MTCLLVMFSNSSVRTKKDSNRGNVSVTNRVSSSGHVSVRKIRDASVRTKIDSNCGKVSVRTKRNSNLGNVSVRKKSDIRKGNISVRNKEHRAGKCLCVKEMGRNTVEHCLSNDSFIQDQGSHMQAKCARGYK